MNFNFRFSLVVIILFLVGGCSTEPVIFSDKLDDSYFITCSLWPEPYSTEEGLVYKQIVEVQQVKYLVELAFGEDDPEFGVSDAVVTLYAPDSAYVFSMESPGVYYYYPIDTNSIATFGEEYTLMVDFADGAIAQATITTPILTFTEPKDTIWIYPDSMTSWVYAEWSNRPEPVAVAGIGRPDTIHYSISDDSFVNQPTSTDITWDPYYGSHDTISFYERVIVSNESIIYHIACESPTEFIENFRHYQVEMWFNIDNIHADNYSRIRWDDWYPLDVEGISNFEGAYGIMTSESYRITKSYIIAVRE